MELLALPLGFEHAGARAKGFGLLRRVVWETPGLASDMAARDALLDQAKHLLTSAEEVGAVGGGGWLGGGVGIWERDLGGGLSPGLQLHQL
jgi:hypothetical protein